MSSEKSNSLLSDFGINSKHNHHIPETFLSNSIVLSASFFGSIYLFSTSLIGFNKKWIKDDKYSFGAFDVVNGSVMFFSGLVMVVTSVKAFQILSK